MSNLTDKEMEAKRIIYALMEQHACYGKVDIPLVQSLIEYLGEKGVPIDSQLLLHLVALQSLLLIDLRAVLENHHSEPRVQQCMAVNAVIHSYIVGKS